MPFSTQVQNTNSAGVQHKVKLRHGYLHHHQHKGFTILGSTCNSYHRTAEPVFAKRYKPFKFGRCFCCDLSCDPLTCGFRNFALVILPYIRPCSCNSYVSKQHRARSFPRCRTIASCGNNFKSTQYPIILFLRHNQLCCYQGLCGTYNYYSF